MPATGITRGIATWKFQDHYVERFMDNAAYTAAHPDDTLVVAGPPRTPSATGTVGGLPGSARTIESQLLAIGHLQTVQFTQQKPTQPVMAIGSGRTFFVSGKAQGQCTLGRLFVNGRNMLRVLYHNARLNDLQVQEMDDKPAKKAQDIFYINLDSELYLIPFGLGTLFRDKIHDVVGGFYAELAMITSWAIGFNAGQNMIMEQVTIVFDRLLPFFEDITDQYKIPQSTFTAIMGFTDATIADAQAKDGGMGKSST